MGPKSSLGRRILGAGAGRFPSGAGMAKGWRREWRGPGIRGIGAVHVEIPAASAGMTEWWHGMAEWGRE